MKNLIFFFSFLMISFMLVGQSAMKVASGGEIGMGINNPERQLHIQGSNALARIDRTGNSAPGFLLNNMNAAGTVNEKVYFFGVAGNSNGYFFIGDYGSSTSGSSTRRLTVDNDGDVIIGTSTSESSYKLRVEGSAFKTTGGSEWNVLSDRQLKKNIKSYTGGLNTIMAINPVQYEYNGKAGTIDGDRNIGVIAQELRKVAPMMVDEFEYISDNGKVDIDADNGENSASEKLLSVNPSALKWMLVNAIKEQQTVIEELQDQITELTEKVSLLNVEDSNTLVELSDVALNNLEQNQPNPYHEQTVIEYNVASSSKTASMKFYNMNGQLIKTVSLPSGNGKVTVSADELPAGSYTYSLEVDGQIVSNKKMVKMR